MIGGKNNMQASQVANARLQSAFVSIVGSTGGRMQNETEGMAGFQNSWDKKGEKSALCHMRRGGAQLERGCARKLTD